MGNLLVGDIAVLISGTAVSICVMVVLVDEGGWGPNDTSTATGTVTRGLPVDSPRYPIPEGRSAVHGSTSLTSGPVDRPP